MRSNLVRYLQPSLLALNSGASCFSFFLVQKLRWCPFLAKDQTPNHYNLQYKIIIQLQTKFSHIFLTSQKIFYPVKTRLKKFSPRPRGKSVIGKILFVYMIKVAKVIFLKSLCWISFLNNFLKNVWNKIWQKAQFLDQELF